MVTEFKLPELGEDIDSGDVINVLVKPGDTVAEEQPVMEIETDKATIEVPAPVSGTIKEIHVKAGTKVKVGQLLFTIDEGGKGDGKEAEAKSTKSENEDEKESEPEQIKSKEAGEGKKGKKETRGEKGKESTNESKKAERKSDEADDEVRQETTSLNSAVRLKPPLNLQKNSFLLLLQSAD